MITDEAAREIADDLNKLRRAIGWTDGRENAALIMVALPPLLARHLDAPSPWSPA